MIVFQRFRTKRESSLNETWFGKRRIVAASEEVNIRHIVNCLKVDRAYGEGVAKAIGMKMDTVK